MLDKDRSFETALLYRLQTCLSNTLQANLVRRDLQCPPFGFVSIFHVTRKSLCGHRLLSCRVTYRGGNPMRLHIVPGSDPSTLYKINFLKNSSQLLN